MCGRYTLGLGRPGEFDARFGGRVDMRALRRYNVAPTEAVPVVRRALAGPERQTINAYWGLLPPWATSRRERLKPINARVETLTDKKLFAPLVATAEHRVLIPADGWYEWLRREDPRKRASAPGAGPSGDRVPFLHTVDGGDPFAFAGLAREVRLRDEVAGLDPAGRPYGGPGVDEHRLVTVAIVTCEASPSASHLHDRMPAVLSGPDEEAAWLSPDVDGRDAIALCAPLADERLRIAPASPLVNSVRSADGPWLLDPSVTVVPGDEGVGGDTDPQTQLDLSERPDA